jgi:uncharacterized ion transporter superfamily protein YfcC
MNRTATGTDTPAGKQSLLRHLHMPHTLVVVMALVIIVLGTSWIVPSGEYQRVAVKTSEGIRNVTVAGTYHQVEKVYLGVHMVLLSPIKGFLDGALLICFLLMIGGSFAIFQETGAVEFGIRKLTASITRRPYLEGALIPALMIVFSLAGSVFGMAEETIPFVLIFIPLARSLGYDSIVGASIPFLGAAAGFAAAFFNPFTVGIAQSISGVPLYSGLAYRLVTWVVGTAVMIAYVMWYARRVKARPELSPVRDLDLEREAVRPHNGEEVGWDLRHAATLSVFVASMVLLVVGVLLWKWYIDQIAVLFFGMGILLGFVGGMGPSRVARTFVTGAKDMVGVVFIVACARALLVIAQDAKIMDTILYGTSHLLSALPRGVIAQLMFLLQCGINFFIHSGTAQAALTMPIMAPLADLVGITRQTAVYAYQLCEFVNPILPTSAVTMGVLGAAKIPWERWARFVWPLILILVVLSFLLLVPPVLFFQWN